MAAWHRAVSLGSTLWSDWIRSLSCGWSICCWPALSSERKSTREPGVVHLVEGAAVAPLTSEKSIEVAACVLLLEVVVPGRRISNVAAHPLTPPVWRSLLVAWATTTATRQMIRSPMWHYVRLGVLYHLMSLPTQNMRCFRVWLDVLARAGAWSGRVW